MLGNKLKRALENGGSVFGLGMTGPIEVPVLRVLANCGVDWLFLDMEHGSLDIGDVLTVVQMADALGMCSVVRVPDLRYQWIARALDTGALSVMVPRVETADQAEQAVRWAKYPPQGVRGAGSPSYLSYAPASWGEGIEISNRETMVVLQIETQTAVENAAAIASVPGVDALFVGPLDLSVSLGRPGDTTSGESHRCVREVCSAAGGRGLAIGIVCAATQASLYHEMGVRMFSFGTALGYLRAGVLAARAEFETQVSERGRDPA
jgi:2-dehydro-3-deoxyglucarate aldolase/4-hydroxy-2-oxoheptanedioate aldolase